MLHAVGDCHIGIDVSKSRLDVAVHETGETFSCANTSNGFVKLIESLKKLSPNLIVMEASGGYEKDLLFSLLTEGLPAAVVNARLIYNFAKATGRLAKTDQIDAQVIAHFALTVQPQVHLAPTALQQALTELVMRRRAMIEILVSEKNRLLQTRTEPARRHIQDHVNWLKSQLEEIDEELRQFINNSETWKELDQLISSVPGVGLVGSATLIALLPELGKLNRRQIASLVGVAPFNQDSGQKIGQRRIWGGRPTVRTALYLCAVAGLRCNPMIRASYDHLKKQGKPGKVALIACTRKLLITLNAMVKARTPWDKNRFAIA